MRFTLREIGILSLIVHDLFYILEECLNRQNRKEAGDE
jgi:hypothetical protein